MSKLATYTNSKTFKFSDQQINTFEKLEGLNVNVSKFVRIAIKEKIERDYKSLQPKLNLSKIKDRYF